MMTLTAELICCTERASRGACLVSGFFVRCAWMSFTVKALIAAASWLSPPGQPWGENIGCLLPRLLRQPGERLCYGCHASQDRRNVSAVPAPPGVSTQPLSSCLAYPGSEKHVNSVNSKIIGVTDRNSKITGVMNRRKSNPLTMFTDF